MIEQSRKIGKKNESYKDSSFLSDDMRRSFNERKHKTMKKYIVVVLVVLLSAAALVAWVGVVDQLVRYDEYEHAADQCESGQYIYGYAYENEDAAGYNYVVGRCDSYGVKGHKWFSRYVK